MTKKIGRILSLVLTIVMVLSLIGSLDNIAGNLISYGADETETAYIQETETSQEEASSDASVTPAAAEEAASGEEATVSPPAEETTPASETKTTEAETAASETTLAMREIKATLSKTVLEEVLENGEKKDTEAYTRVEDFWESLMKRKAAPWVDDGKPHEAPLAVTVKGTLPEDVTAEVSYIEFDEEKIYSEEALFAIDLTLKDGQGNLYIPEQEISVVISGSAVKSAVTGEKTVLVYSYNENTERKQELLYWYGLDQYAADVLVSREQTDEESRRAYEVYDENKYYEPGEAAVRYTEDDKNLTVDKTKNEITVKYQPAQSAEELAKVTGTMHLVLSAQNPDRYVYGDSDNAAVWVYGALDQDTSAEVTDAEVTLNTDGTAAVAEAGSADAAESGENTETAADSRYQTVMAVNVEVADKEAGTYQPDQEVELTISNAELKTALEKAEAADADLEVWSVAEDGSAAKIDDAVITEDYVSFNVSNLATYAVIEHTKEKYYKDSEGNNWKITVSYKEDCGIPENAVLEVSEITESDAGYAEYVTKSTETLGVDAEQVSYAKAFDIKLLNPETLEEYQPEGANVKVSVELMDEPLNGSSNVDVVHFHGQYLENTETAQALETSVNGQSVEFETDGFSVYVIIEHEGGAVTTPRVEFHFIDKTYTENSDSSYSAGPYNFVNTAGTYQTTQIIKSGEALETINNPGNIKVDNGDGTYSEKFFYGWYVVSESEDTSALDSDTGKYTGTITYTWPETQKIEFTETLSLTTTDTDGDGVIEVGDSVTWTLGDATGTGTIDSDGNVHVYLAPMYEDYYFVNFRMGAKEDSSLGNSLLARKLVVFGDNTTASVRIGNVECPSPDTQHQIFVGWETVTEESGSLVRDQYYQTVDYEGNELNSEGSTDGYYITITKTDSSLKSIDLYPVFAEARWFKYNTGLSGNGAKYVGSAYLVTHDEGAGTYFDSTYYASHLSTRTGYTFNGWYIFANQDSTTGNISNLSDAEDVTFSYVDESGDTQTTTFNTTAVQLVDGSGEVQDIGTYYVASDGTISTTASDDSSKLLEVVDGQIYAYKALDDLTLYADWTENTETSYRVVIWKQKVTDDKDATDDEKTYDYEIYYTKSDADTTEVPDLSDFSGTYVDSDGNTQTVSNLDLLDQSWDGFTYSRNDVADIGAPDPDGTTVYNVYYDRDLMTMSFYTYTNDYTYTETTGSDTPQYALVDGEWVELTRGEETETTTEYFLTQTDGGTTEYSGTVYDEDGNEVSDPVYGTTYYYRSWVSYGRSGYYAYYELYWNSRTVTTYEWLIPEYGDVYTLDNTDGTYGLVDGEYVELTPVTETTTGDVDVYVLKSSLTTGNDYLIVSGNSASSGFALGHSGTTVASDAVTINEGTDDSGNAAYIYASDVDSTSIWTASSGYTFANGGYYISQSQSGNGFGGGQRSLAISTTSLNWNWNTDNNILSCTPGRTTYYLRYNNGFSISSNAYSIYLYVSDTITEETTIVTGYTYNGTEYTGDRYTKSYGQTGNTTVYTGTRYTKSDNTSTDWHLYKQFTGLYGQSLQQNGYVWDETYDWYSGYYGSTGYGTRTTFLDAFLPTDNTTVLKFYGDDPEGSTYIYFYKQKINSDGTLSTEYELANSVSTNATAFNLSDKYNGFTCTSWRNGETGTLHSVGELMNRSGNYYYDADPDTSGYQTASISGDLRIYFNRNLSTLTFDMNYPVDDNLSYSNGQSDNLTVSDIYYESSLSDYGYTYNSSTKITHWYCGVSDDENTADNVIYGPDHYVFGGWYEDASCTVEFDFSETMPSANKIVYAKWTAERFRVMIDPNGAEIDHINHNYDNDSTDESKQGYFGYWYDADGNAVTYTSGNGVTPFATFNRAEILASDGVTVEREADSGYDRSMSTLVNASYGTTITEYTLERNYVPISDSAAASYTGQIYYYVNTQYMETDGTGPASDCRNAVYVTEDEIDEYYDFYYDWTNGNIIGGYITGTTLLDEDTWRQTYVSSQKYRIANSNEHWTFLGWYKVVDGVMDSMPYDFSSIVTEAFTLKAMWRLDGSYSIQYVPEYTMSDGSLINGEMDAWTDPASGSLYYADGATTTVYKAPTGLTIDGTEITDDSVIFLGWQLVTKGGTVDNPVYTAVEEGTYYDPSDSFTIEAGDADTSGIIYLQAVYQYKSGSDRRPEVTNLTLDANTGYITSSDSADLPEWNYPGTHAINTEDNLLTVDGVQRPTQILFGDIQSSAAVHLYRYASEITEDASGAAVSDAKQMFKHPNGYFLLGFDESATEGDYVPTYSADSAIAVERDDDQTLYAVWEPMVYLTIKNETGTGPVTFAITSTDNETLEVINVRYGMYQRTPITDLSAITLEDGETIMLAFPKGAESDIQISGTNTLGVGKALVWNTSLDLVEGETVTSYDTAVTGANIDFIHNVDGSNCVHTLPTGEANNTKTFSIDEQLLVNENALTVTFTEKDNAYALILDDNYDDGGTQEYDYSLEDVTPEDGVAKTQTLPSTSTRVGYEFEGWAYSADATEADFSATSPTEAPWTIQDLNPTDGFFSEGTTTSGETVVRTLYGVWRTREEAQHVYIYKNVPAPGNQEQEFTFTVNVTGTYYKKTNSSSGEAISASDTFTLAHGEYAELVSSNSTSEGYIQSVITLYNEDGTRKTDASGTELDSITVRAEASETDKNGSFKNTESITVTETAADYYATTMSRLSQVNDDYYLKLGESADKDTNPLNDISGNAVSWTNTDAGGSVVFTNTRQTYDVTVAKTLVSNTSTSSIFSYTASYDDDGTETTLDDFNVTSGSTTMLEDIPAGADLTITETADANNNYDTTVQVGSDAAETAATKTFTVSADTTVTFANTLKSYNVTMQLVDQDGNASINGMFSLASSIGSLGTSLYASASAADPGVFYTSDQFWADTYTLTQTVTPTGYIGLSDAVTLTVTGNGITSSSSDVVVSGDAENGYVITVKNRATKTITLNKILSDPLLTSTRTFEFSCSYIPQGETDAVTKTFTLAPVSNDTAGASYELTVPIYSSVTVTETTDGDYAAVAETYDTTVEKDSEGAASASTYTIDSVTDDAALTFTNTRKTTDVTVSKTLDDVLAAGGESFDFTAVLSYANSTLSSYNENDFASGTQSFSLVNTSGSETKTLTVPVGAVLQITEDTSSISSIYTTTVTYYNGTTTTDPAEASEYTISSVPNASDQAVAFTNSRKTADVTINKQLVDTFIATDTAVDFGFTATLKYNDSTLESFSDTNFTSGIYSGITISATPADGGTLTIEDLPVGTTLEIIETADDKYTTTVSDVVTDTATVDVTDGTNAVTFVNTRKTGDVTITKNLEDSYIDSSTSVDFGFSATVKEDDATLTSFSNTQFLGGVYSAFTISASPDTDGTLTLSGLPVGAVLEITETANDQYKTEVDGTETTTASVSIVEGSSDVTFVNTRITQPVKIFKTDADNTAISGASFSLNGSTYATGSDGYTDTILLPVGDTAFTLRETVVPAGYMPAADSAVTVTKDAVTISDGEAAVSYDDTNQVWVITVTDEKPVCKLTDASGNLLYYENNGIYYPAVYTTLEAGFADAQSGTFYTDNAGSAEGTAANVEMLSDYTQTAGITLAADQTLTLTTAGTSDTDGYPSAAEKATVTRDSSNSDILITNNGTLTVSNITLDGNNVTLTADGGLISSAGTLTISEDAVLTNSTTSGLGGAVYSSGTLTMNGTISNCTAAEGGAVYSSSDLTMAGTISGCTATTQGGAIYASGALTMAGTISTCSAANGSAIYAADSSSVSLTGTVSGCAATAGSTIYAGTDAAVTMTAGSISGNTATSGSAIYLYNAVMHMSGGSITGNSGASDGAVVYAGDVTDGTETGGKIYLSGDVVIYNNTDSAGDAANIYLGVEDANIIRTEDSGLGDSAQVGVKAIDGYNAMGNQFATAANSANTNLDKFINDIYGYKGELKSGSTNTVIWGGFDLTVTKNLDSGTTTDTFTITISSDVITESSYTHSGIIDNNFTVTPASGDEPGTIVLTGVAAGQTVGIEDLPLGLYTVTEEECSYTPAIEVLKEGSTQSITMPDSGFTLNANTAVTITNTRKTTDVTLTKSLDDVLASDAVSFTYHATLTEADGTTVIKTYDPVTLSPTNDASASYTFEDVSVGAILTITETVGDEYTVTTAVTDADGNEITDTSSEENVVIFTVPESTVAVDYLNTRKTAEVVVSKTLDDVLKDNVDFTFNVQLLSGSSAVADYTLYDDADDDTYDIVTDSEGNASFTLTATDGSTVSKTLTVPVGAMITVAETPVTESVDGTDMEIYDTTVSVDGATAEEAVSATIDSVTTAGSTLAFTNTRKMQTITVTKTVNGYSGDSTEFTFTAALTYDSAAVDYDENSFTDGSQTFTLKSGGSQTLTVPLGGTLKITETENTAFNTQIECGSGTSAEGTEIEFVIKEDDTVAYTNNELIRLQLINDTANDMENVQVYVSTSDEMYIMNTDGTLTEVTMTSRTGTVTVPAGETVTLAVTYSSSQSYTVSGTGHDNYYLTVINEPSYHQYADPAIQRVYGTASFSVSGKLLYGPADSYVQFTEQPMVAFDVNGGAWTTEMQEEGYHDRDGDGKVWQMPVTSGETVSAPTDPVYTAADYVTFYGWTTDASVAADIHTDQEDLTSYLYDFTTAVTAPFTLYAIWVKETVAVTFDYGSGTWTETSSDYVEVPDTTTYVLTIEKGEKAVQPADPTLTDYAFLGWTADAAYAGAHDFADGTISLADAKAALYNFNTAVTEDTTLYAVYGVTVTVTFDLTYDGSVFHTWNDADTSYYVPSTDGSQYVATVIKGDTVSEPVNPSHADDAENKAFLKWTTSASYCGAALPYAEMGSVSGFDFSMAVTENLVLYTSWVIADSTVITIQKDVTGVVDPDQEFTFTYRVDENTYSNGSITSTTTGSESSFTLKPGESRSITIYANPEVAASVDLPDGLPMMTQTLVVTENETTGYEMSGVTETLTSTGESVSAGTTDLTTRTYSVEAVNVSGSSYTRWDPNKEGITADIINERKTQTVTVENYVSNASGSYTYTAVLTDGGDPVTSFTAGTDVTTGAELTTDANGQLSFTISGNGAQDLEVSYGVKLVVSLESTEYSSYGYSGDYTDGDSTSESFTVDPVDQDGTIIFVSGVCKITDSSGETLWFTDDTDTTKEYPAVYMLLSNAFTDYTGKTLHEKDASDTVTPAATKMLVDEYTIQQYAALDLPAAEMTLTTSESSDATFPYVGTKTRSAIYRYASGNNTSCFSLADSSGNITLTNIILDGGSESGNYSKKETFGGLINMSAGTLNITTGATLRNQIFWAYNDTNWGRGGAVYMSAGTLNMDAGLISNCKARKGGAICVETDADVTLNITGSDGSTQFEDCTAVYNAGGAICYDGSNSITIDGGTDKTNPGIVFERCTAEGNFDGVHGGAVSIASTGTAEITGCSFTECRAEEKLDNRKGGGAVFTYNTSGTTISNCTFTSCDTGYAAGGAILSIIQDDKEVTVTNCDFDSCNAAGQGGAISAHPYSTSDTTAKLTVDTCTFTDCTTGTGNGSGGAIQTYVQYVELKDCSFSNCWAGKEGGAINQYYGPNDGTIWGSDLTVTDCTFDTCRAEDRYYPEQKFHYGGAIATKAKAVTVTGSSFTDCVSTLREGGAIFCFGYGTDSSCAMTIDSSTFTNCSAKTSGGAIYTMTYNLSVTDTTFTSCSAETTNGGAVYHGNSWSTGTNQNRTELSNATFTSCSTGNNGGALWTRGQQLTISSGSMTQCSAANGGALYYEYNNANSSYVGATLNGTTMESNTVTSSNGGAVAVSSTNSKLYFEGDVIVNNNTCSTDGSAHNVALAYNMNTIINTTSTGIGSNAQIGVYVADSNSAYTNHGTAGLPFGTYQNSANLKCFVNDRHDELFGIQLYSSDSKIYWGRYVCKITDADGNVLTRTNGDDAVYPLLSMAFDEYLTVTGGTPAYVKMLVETYNIVQSDELTNVPAAEMILTTAGTTGVDEGYPYEGEDDTVCTISRTNSTKELFKITDSATALTLEDITMDGRKNKTATAGAFRMIEIQGGSLTVGGGTTMQYGTWDGGAIWSKNCTVTVDSTNGDVLFANCTSTGGNGGGAIYASSSVTLSLQSTSSGNISFENCLTSSSGFGGGAIRTDGNLTISREQITDSTYSTTTFTNCSSNRGGALYVKGSTFDIDGAVFESCYTFNYEGGAIQHDNESGSGSITIQNSSFTGCYTSGDAQYAYGGAVASKTGTLELDSCTFTDCYALSSGGAVNHGAEKNGRVKTVITDTTFTNCSTVGTNTSYSYGGAVYTQAKAVEVTSSSFSDCTANNYGGALYCYNEGSSTVISGTSFENCLANRSESYGGAVYSRSSTMTIQDDSEGTGSSFTNCIAQTRGGAVYMEKTNTMTVSGTTVFDGCSAGQGGAIYLKSGDKMILTGTPTFKNNGSATIDSTTVNSTAGAAIYLVEGSSLNMEGTLSFSNNYILDGSIVTNGNVADYPRQDIYLAGYSNNTAASLVVTGELTGSSAIWVWPEQSPHKLAGEQFAQMNDTTISDASLSVFRNALDDSVTSCAGGSFLSGSRGANSTYIYWSASRDVSFLKTDDNETSPVGLANAVFTMYTDAACTTAYVSKTSADGVNDLDSSGNVLDKGTVLFENVPNGVYYMKETQAPTGYTADESVYLIVVGDEALNHENDIGNVWTSGALKGVDQDSVTAVTTAVNVHFAVFPIGSSGIAVVTVNYGVSDSIKNAAGGSEVKFLKIDGYGTVLAGATFTVYTDAACSTALTGSDGNSVTGTSADGTTDVDSSGTVLAKGTVFMETIPMGIYYMKETASPTGYTNTNVYALVIGEDALATAGTGVLTNVSSDNITAQTALYKAAYGDDYSTYAIFQVDSNTTSSTYGKAVTTPDIATYGVLNQSTTERKTIFRKTDSIYGALSGAKVDILRYDRSAVATAQESGTSGCFWIGDLPLGTYYLHETVVPDGYAALSTGDNWYLVTVNADGTTISARLTVAP